MSGGPFALATGRDHLPLDAFGNGADAGADATDASADVNVNGANDVAAANIVGLTTIGAMPVAAAGIALLRSLGWL